MYGWEVMTGRASGIDMDWDKVWVHTYGNTKSILVDFVPPWPERIYITAEFQISPWKVLMQWEGRVPIGGCYNSGRKVLMDNKWLPVYRADVSHRPHIAEISNMTMVEVLGLIAESGL